MPIKWPFSLTLVFKESLLLPATEFENHLFDQLTKLGKNGLIDLPIPQTYEMPIILSQKRSGFDY